MKTFTIDAENNIATHASGKAARETGAAVFATEEQFSDLIGPGTKRLIEIWNSLSGRQSRDEVHQPQNCHGTYLEGDSEPRPD